MGGREGGREREWEGERVGGRDSGCDLEWDCETVQIGKCV